MLTTTQGLVLHTTKYGETSVIAKVFTRELGLCSYIIKGVRSTSGRTKQNLLQPMCHLDMTVYNNPKKNLQYVKEMHPASHYGFSGDSVKTALLFFMDEVLYKSLKEGEQNLPLFDYVVGELQSLSAEDGALASFPISFLVRAARHLGIEPMDNYSHHEPLFNLKEGKFLPTPSAREAMSKQTASDSDYYLDAPSSLHFHSCLSSSAKLTARQRSITLNNLLEYYHIHFSDFKNFKSHEVLHAVLR